jgi:hypothetical protein
LSLAELEFQPGQLGWSGDPLDLAIAMYCKRSGGETTPSREHGGNRNKPKGGDVN